QISPRQITYERDEQSGEATLVNISTAGLLVELATLPVLHDDEICITLSCFKQRSPTESLTFKARIVRVDFDEFAASFIDTTREQTAFLLRLLAQEKRNGSTVESGVRLDMLTNF
ncbi:PilZ domain-containing protein, partial [bacterium]|nr:PilZ domain-containing protein [bacterium]